MVGERYRSDPIRNRGYNYRGANNRPKIEDTNPNANSSQFSLRRSHAPLPPRSISQEGVDRPVSPTKTNFNRRHNGGRWEKPYHGRNYSNTRGNLREFQLRQKHSYTKDKDSLFTKEPVVNTKNVFSKDEFPELSVNDSKPVIPIVNIPPAKEESAVTNVVISDSLPKNVSGSYRNEEVLADPLRISGKTALGIVYKLFFSRLSSFLDPRKCNGMKSYEDNLHAFLYDTLTNSFHCFSMFCKFVTGSDVKLDNIDWIDIFKDDVIDFDRNEFSFERFLTFNNIHNVEQTIEEMRRKTDEEKEEIKPVISVSQQDYFDSRISIEDRNKTAKEISEKKANKNSGNVRRRRVNKKADVSNNTNEVNEIVKPSTYFMQPNLPESPVPSPYSIVYDKNKSLENVTEDTASVKKLSDPTVVNETKYNRERNYNSRIKVTDIYIRDKNESNGLNNVRKDMTDYSQPQSTPMIRNYKSRDSAERKNGRYRGNGGHKYKVSLNDTDSKPGVYVKIKTDRFVTNGYKDGLKQQSSSRRGRMNNVELSEKYLGSNKLTVAAVGVSKVYVINEENRISEFTSGVSSPKETTRISQ